MGMTWGDYGALNAPAGRKSRLLPQGWFLTAGALSALERVGDVGLTGEPGPVDVTGRPAPALSSARAFMVAPVRRGLS
jgi:hypothetical protein